MPHLFIDVLETVSGKEKRSLTFSIIQISDVDEWCAIVLRENKVPRIAQLWKS